MQHDTPLIAAHQTLQEHLGCAPPPQPSRINPFTEESSHTDTNRDIAGSERQRLRHCSERPTDNGNVHSFYTKASILTPGGIVDFERVQVDDTSPFNLLPWSIAINHGLILSSGKLSRTTVVGGL